MTSQDIFRSFIAALATSILAGSALADQPLPYRFYKDLDRETSAGDSIVQVTLDSDIYASTRDRFPDLRVLDENGTEVPFRLERVTSRRTETLRKPCPSEVLSLVENDDGSIVVTVKLDDKAPAADGISILTPLSDYERHVKVLGSRAGSDWTPLVTNGRVFDYSRFMDISNHDVELPKNDDRQFEVVIEEVTERLPSALMGITRELQGEDETRRTESTVVLTRPFRIDRIECWSEESQRQVKGNKKADYAVVNFQTEEDVEEKSTVIRLQTRREPITSLSLKTTSQNFSRHVSVQVPVEQESGSEWVDVGHATLFRVNVGDFHRERLDVTFTEQREQEYRIVIANGDSPPLDVTGIEAEGNIYQMVFFDTDTDALRVCYGSENAELPVFDTTAVLASLDSGYIATQGSLGTQLDNPSYEEQSGTALRRLLNSGFFLVGVIGLVVAVLAWALFHAGRKIDSIPHQ